MNDFSVGRSFSRWLQGSAPWDSDMRTFIKSTNKIYVNKTTHIFHIVLTG